jgi:aryl-alcohol dehydrogenase-like predicted oxidoreductase
LEYRNLGQSGLRVSPLCLGTMMFGGPTDEATADRIIGQAGDAGVNFIDTANVYVNGESERITGRAIAARRSWWVLATKLANPTGSGPNDGDLSRRHAFDAVDASLRRLGMEVIDFDAVDASLRRLGMEVIDVLYLHKEDHRTPLQETVQAMGDLMRAGKIRYFGVALIGFRGGEASIGKRGWEALVREQKRA